MKKLAIVTAIVLATALTAFSLSKTNNNTEGKIENASTKTTTDAAMTLATAD
ncbi:hypothetical protein [Mucilaginibacter antarcticus]|uniref:Entericidin n=1 Tax=Mucilaginibacter antarcticus TaxID=1855725 RepID=A0ABW5XQ97_9SPHI